MAGLSRDVVGMVNTGEAGFGAWELLIVTAILSVFAGLALPRLDFIDSYLLDAEAQCLVADLRYAQELSRTQAYLHTGFGIHGVEYCPVRLVFAPREKTYYMDGEEKIRGLRRHYFPQGMRAVFDNPHKNVPSVNFDRYGDLTPTCTIELVFHGQSRKVIVDGVGRIRVERGGASWWW